MRPSKHPGAPLAHGPARPGGMVNAPAAALLTGLLLALPPAVCANPATATPGGAAAATTAPASRPPAPPAAAPASASLAPAAAPAAALDAGMVNPGHHEKPDWFKNSFLDLREDVADAARAGKRVALYFYQDGCPYCKKLLEDNFGQKDISALARSKFDFIAVNMWGDRDVTGLKGEAASEKAFSTGLKVMFTPTFLFLNEQGEVVLRANGYYPPHKFKAALTWLAEKREKQQPFLEYYGQQAPDKTTGRLHAEPGYLPAPLVLDAKQRKPAKPLLVLFEQKQCAQCDELHLDILRRPESKEQAARFDIALLDIWSSEPVVTPGGQKTTAREWARQLGILHAPSLLFFDTAGAEVFRTEGYLKAFHIQSAMDYAASGAYKIQPSFQRFISARADALEAKGIHIDLMK